MSLNTTSISPVNMHKLQVIVKPHKVTSEVIFTSDGNTPTVPLDHYIVALISVSQTLLCFTQKRLLLLGTSHMPQPKLC